MVFKSLDYGIINAEQTICISYSNIQFLNILLETLLLTNTKRQCSYSAQ